MTNHAPVERKKCRRASHTNLYASGIAAASSVGDIAESPAYWDARRKILYLLRSSCIGIANSIYGRKLTV